MMIIFSAATAAFFGGLIKMDQKDGPTKHTAIDPDQLALASPDMS
jgi:hypothetical protein